MPERKRKTPPLLIQMALKSGGILLLMVLLSGALAFGMYQLGIFHIRGPLMGLTMLIAFSAAIGTFFTSVISKRYLRPLVTLIEATSDVSQGNFNVQLSETVNSEMDELIHNFNLMVRELSQIEMLRSDFVNNISHEIRTPVAAIENCATMLESGVLSETELHEYASMIAKNARRLSTLSQSVLRLSKLESQEIIDKPKTYRVDEQIRQALVMLENQWTEKRLVLDIDLPELKYSGNKELIMQVWINLLENAIKFSHEQAKLHVRLIQNEQETLVVIQDHGIGMTLETQKRIFEKFYQGDPSRATQGHGLGLALVDRIMRMCGGKVAVESSPGNGSVFIVHLPNNL